MQVANNQTQQYLYQNQTVKSENKNSENFNSLLNQQENTQADQTLKTDKVELNYSSKNDTSTGIYPTNLTNSKPLEKTTETVGLTDALQTENSLKKEERYKPIRDIFNNLFNDFEEQTKSKLEEKFFTSDSMNDFESGNGGYLLGTMILAITVADEKSYESGKSIDIANVQLSSLGDSNDIKDFLTRYSELYKAENPTKSNIFQEVLGVI